MVLKTQGTYTAIGRGSGVYVPTEMTKDSQFPFKEGDVVEIKIVGRSLVVRPAEEGDPNDS